MPRRWSAKEAETGLSFYEHGKSVANDTEMLLWALLIWHSGHYTASELKTWAKAALRERPQAEALEDAWKPKLSWDATNNVSDLYEPVVKDFHQRPDVLEHRGPRRARPCHPGLAWRWSL